MAGQVRGWRFLDLADPAHDLLSLSPQLLSSIRELVSHGVQQSLQQPGILSAV